MATTNRSGSTLALVLLAAVAAWGSGCTQGSSAPGSAGASDAVAASALALEFCDSVTAAQYDRIGGCQGASQELIASWKSKAHASCQALAGEVSAGRAAFDDARARSCAAAIAPLDCASAARR